MRTTLLSVLAALATPAVVAAQQAPTGPELAGKLRMLRASSDTSALQQVLADAAAITDSSIYNAAHEIGADASASPEARITSLGVLLAYERNGFYVWYSGLAATPGSNEYCVGVGGRSDFHSIPRTPLPSDYHARTLQVATAVLSDSGTPSALRNAARCVLIAYETRRAAVPVDSSLIQLVYVCGNRFTIRNGNTRVVTVGYQVVGSSERWNSLGVAARPDSLSYGETPLRTQATGPVQLLYNGQVIQTVANGGTTCPQ